MSLSLCSRLVFIFESFALKPSHCVLTITVSNTLVPSAEPGRLVLVDLAGSERAVDRSVHTKDRMDEVILMLYLRFLS